MKGKEKKPTIASLQKEIATLKTIVSLMPGNVYWKDKHGSYLGCNNRVAEILHLKKIDDIIGKTDVELIGAAFAKKTKVIDNNVLQNNREQEYEETGWDDKGNPATYLSRKVPLHDAKGKMFGILGVSFDITDRKRIEDALKAAKQKAESANKEKTRFLANISHELRTPLTSVLGFASLIGQTNLEGEKKKEYINHIIQSGSYLLSLINSLLDYNKLETDNFELTDLPLNLKELTESIVAMLGGTAKLKNVDLILDYDKDVPEHIMGDSRALRQILINLIGNAIKFTARGHITVSLHCVKSTAKTATLQIAVKDTGIGIPPQEQKSIFKRFYQLGNVYTRSSNLTGTGLGLAIVKKLVKLLGSKIELKSIPNQGSTFYFNVTLTKASFDDAPWLPYAASVKILVVQDDSTKNHIATLLSNTSYDVVSSNEAINMLFTAQQAMHPFDIIMVDQDLKHTTPKKLVLAIKDLCDLHQPLPIIMGTTNAKLIKNTLHLKVSPTPTAPDVRDFQMQLKLAWEARSKELPTKTQQSYQPYVLIVEDNVLIQIVHKHLLEELGYKVDIADSAKATLEMLHNNYDLLLVDIGLPEISGLDLIKMIRRRHDKDKNIPIVVLTGYSEEEERQHCLEAGANEVATKPISKITLSKILDRFVKVSI